MKHTITFLFLILCFHTTVTVYSEEVSLAGRWEFKKAGTGSFRITINTNGTARYSTSREYDAIWEIDGDTIRIDLPNLNPAWGMKSSFELKTNDEMDQIYWIFNGHKAIATRENSSATPNLPKYMPTPDEILISTFKPTRDSQGMIEFSKQAQQDEFAIALAWVLKINDQKELRNQIDAFNELSANNIVPPNGIWASRYVVTRGLLASILVQALWQDAGIDPTDQRKCLEFVQSKGCLVKSVGEVLSFIENHTK